MKHYHSRIIRRRKQTLAQHRTNPHIETFVRDWLSVTAIQHFNANLLRVKHRNERTSYRHSEKSLPETSGTFMVEFSPAHSITPVGMDFGAHPGAARPAINGSRIQSDYRRRPCRCGL